MSEVRSPDRPTIRVAVLGMRCGFTEAVVSQMMMNLDSVNVRNAVDSGDQAEPARIEIVVTAIAMPELGSIGSGEGWSGQGDTAIIGAREGLRNAAFRTWLEDLRPDAILMACFPWKLPAWIVGLPTFGSINVHPSLLPDGRGAEPLFWAFRWGLSETGVTVHLVDGGWDTGPILAQRTVQIQPGATVPSLERDLAVIGGDLAREVLLSLDAGSVEIRPQVASNARYAPNPSEQDLRIDTNWTAEGAARFMRAVIPSFGPVTVTVLATGQECLIAQVLDVTATETDAPPMRWQGKSLSIPFADGSLTVQLVASAGDQPVFLQFPKGSRP